MARTIPEQTPTSPNFLTTPAEGRLPPPLPVLSLKMQILVCVGTNSRYNNFFFFRSMFTTQLVVNNTFLERERCEKILNELATANGPRCPFGKVDFGTEGFQVRNPTPPRTAMQAGLDR
ncbi:hypothetical protein AVEN_182545-1 [Araneus ventricosus]|uniref:Uncharacterized protein n=1 Tax=Araneus ventricosus TaxID=182803 RepID=A0A4Y2BYU3_ARAVE|nr:hypothetical protein AVEN_182545-1 [Araneus ventricosus]